jgi:peptidoglycan/LPS O-acetylase OafA/YrhL
LPSEKPPVSQPSGRLPGLDALRGIAALCVLGLHVSAEFRGVPWVFGKAYLAVDFFFVLSGYVMARTYEKRLRDGASPWRFFASRYRRLWPMMALGGALSLPLLFLKTDSITQFSLLAVPNMLLLPVAFNQLVFPLNPPAWSIFFELVANLAHGLGLHRLRRRGMAVLVILSAAAMVGICLWHGNFDVGARPENVLGGLPRVTLAYCLGILMWRWWRDVPNIAVPPIPTLFAMPVMFVGAWALGIHGWWFDLAFILIACPLMLAGGLRLRGLEKFALASGELSFPLYALHSPVLRWARYFEHSPLVGAVAALGVSATVTYSAFGWRERQIARETHSSVA